MDIKESELSKNLGIPRAEFKGIRNAIKGNHDLGVLWYREESKKPEHLRCVYWTDNGIMYLMHYLKVKQLWNEEVSKPMDTSVMTKEDFNNTVNDTEWVGKVTGNQYKNRKLIQVEHEIGYKVVVNCKDNSLYSKSSFVVVDTKNFRHSVRKPQYRTYEKALKDCKRK